MKTAKFRGKEFVVPDWARYIGKMSSDNSSTDVTVYAFEVRPDKLWEKTEGRIVVVGSDTSFREWWEPC